jgi:hypothetical protein
MTTIKAACHACGEVNLAPDDIVLRIGALEGINTYGFSCPSCTEFIQKPADDRVVRLLLSGGVIPIVLHIPAEALERHDGPVFGPDDLIEFHLLLQRSDWFARLKAVGSAENA